MSLWTTKVVRHFIYTRFGLAYCRERVRQVRHVLGFRPRRLRHRHLQAKAEGQAAFRAGLEGRLPAWPEEWGWLLVAEATVRRHPTLTAQWWLAEDGPEVPTGDDHPKVHVYGAVAPLTGRTRHHLNPKLRQEALARFVRRLRRDYRGKRLLVSHARAAQHTGRLIDTVRQGAEGRLVLMPQPAYSPELHPQERLWQWWRRVVAHHHWFGTLAQQVPAGRDVFCYPGLLLRRGGR